MKNNFTDDQKALGAYMNEYPDRVAADIDAKVLHTTSSGVNGGFYTNEQISDSISLLELLGRKNFFLHIPGLNFSHGQKINYDMVKTLINNNFSQRLITDTYSNYPIEKLKWEEIFKIT